MDLNPKSKMALRKAINIAYQFNSKIILLNIHKEFASKKDMDLIVMGTNGRNSLSDYIVGSTTQKVIENAKCSVLVMPKGN